MEILIALVGVLILAVGLFFFMGKKKKPLQQPQSQTSSQATSQQGGQPQNPVQ